MIALECKLSGSLNPSQSFERFGASQISVPNRRLRSLDIPHDKIEARQLIRERCPVVAGVYGWIDRAGELIYVGYSSKLQQRLLTYLLESDEARKEYRVKERSVKLVWEEIGHQLAAQLRELELIRRFQPLMNRKGRSIRSATAYLRIEGGNASRVTFSEAAPPKGELSWGPLPMNRRMIDAVQQLNLTFGLADCSREVPLTTVGQNTEANSVEYGCLRGETGSCSAPCAPECTAEKYAAQVQQTQKFLDGEAIEVIDHLKTSMEKSKSTRDYHAAARQRDRWQALEYLQYELELLRNPTLHEMVYAPAINGRRYWFIIRNSMVEWVGREPNRPEQASTSLLNLNASAASPYGVQTDRTMQQIVNHWFHSHPVEIESTLTLKDARNHCSSVIKS